MPAWIAGIQVRRMRPETSMSAWIPALHAGMTESRIVLKLTEALQPRIFKGERKDRVGAGFKPALVFIVFYAFFAVESPFSSSRDPLRHWRFRLMKRLTNDIHQAWTIVR